MGWFDVKNAIMSKDHQLVQKALSREMDRERALDVAISLMSEDEKEENAKILSELGFTIFEHDDIEAKSSQLGLTLWD